MTKTRVAIIQDYVPKYRVPFFAGLTTKLSESDIEISVIAGSPTGKQASRGDAVTKADWLHYQQPHKIDVKPIDVPFYGSSKLWRRCDGVIMILRGNSADLNIELSKKPFSGRRVATWGHIKPYVKSGNRVDLAVERNQLRFSDHVFAYTRSGADFAVKSGIPPSRVTAVMNSVDVTDLEQAFTQIESSAVSEFENRHNLTRGKTFGYIGGIDEAKRIELLADTLDIIWERDPTVKLLVGGRGDQEELFHRAVQRGQVEMLGYADSQTKALISHVSQAILNPGRIGLLAIDGLATGTPILTTDWMYHGPEFEYLREAEDVFRSAGNSNAYADLVLSFTTGYYAGHEHKISKQYPTLDAMILNFADGVRKMMFNR